MTIISIINIAKVIASLFLIRSSILLFKYSSRIKNYRSEKKHKEKELNYAETLAARGEVEFLKEKQIEFFEFTKKVYNTECLVEYYALLLSICSILLACFEIFLTFTQIKK